MDAEAGVIIVLVVTVVIAVVFYMRAEEKLSDLEADLRLEKVRTDILTRQVKSQKEHIESMLQA